MGVREGSVAAVNSFMNLNSGSVVANTNGVDGGLGTGTINQIGGTFTARCIFVDRAMGRGGTGSLEYYGGGTLTQTNAADWLLWWARRGIRSSAEYFWDWASYFDGGDGRSDIAGVRGRLKSRWGTLTVPCIQQGDWGGEF